MVKSTSGEALKSNTVVWSILSALGGAALVIIGQVAVEAFKGTRQEAAEVRSMEVTRAIGRTASLDTLFREFEELGNIRERAAAYIQRGRQGSKGDVEAVARHFRRLTRYLRTNRISLAEASTHYGGILTYWGERFSRIASGESPASRRFSPDERVEYRELAEALNFVERQVPRRYDPLSRVNNWPRYNSRPVRYPASRRPVDDGEYGGENQHQEESVTNETEEIGQGNSALNALRSEEGLR